MARASRAKAKATAAAAAATTPTKALKKEETKGAKTSRDKHNALRRKLYKKARRARQVAAVQAALRKANANAAAAAGEGDPGAEKKQLASLRGQAYRQWRPRGAAGAGRAAELERLVRLQREEIEALRRSLGQRQDEGIPGGVPRLEPPVSPAAADEGVDSDEGPDSSPVKIRQQLLNDVSQSPARAGEEAREDVNAPREPSTVVEVEEIVETTAGGNEDVPEGMEGVEATTVAASIEKDVDYPTLPSVELEEEAPVVDEEVQQTIEEDISPAAAAAAAVDESDAKEQQATAAASTPAPTSKNSTPSLSREQARDSSAEGSNAGTPRNVRRSPRKRTVKRRSFAGHSYAG